YKVAKVRFVEGYGEGVDGEVAAVLIVFYGAALYFRLAAVGAVGFFAGTYELNLEVGYLNLCCAKILKVGNLWAGFEVFYHLMCQGYSIAHTDYVCVLSRAAYELISYKAPYKVAWHFQLLCCCANMP